MPNAVLYPATTEGAAAVGGALGRFRAEFPVAPLASQWDVVTGAGMTLSPAQTSQGTVLAVAMGTTAGSSTSLQSTQIFTAPVKATASIQLSQKIINQTVFFEVVGCDVNGVTDEASVLSWAFTGNDNLTTSNASIETQNNGAARVRLTNQTVQTYVGAIGTTAPVATFEIEHLTDEAWFHCRLSDSVAGRANSLQRSTTIPDSPYYKVRLRFVNGGTAPASVTTVYVGHVTADSHSELPVEVVNSRGGVSVGQALPVQVLNTAQVSLAANQVLSQQVSTGGLAPTATRFDAVLAAAQTVKATAGRFHYVTVFNPNAAMAALHFYNATAPTVGTTVPIYTLAVPANGALHVDVGGLPLMAFTTALTVAATTTATTAGAVAPTTGLVATVGWI